MFFIDADLTGLEPISEYDFSDQFDELPLVFYDFVGTGDDDSYEGHDDGERAVGYGGDDSLQGGGGGGDTLFGNSGDDTMLSFGGHNVLFGGSGADLFGSSFTPDLLMPHSLDVIMDYDAADGDQINGSSYVVIGGNTTVYSDVPALSGSGFTVLWTLESYDADAQGIILF